MDEIRSPPGVSGSNRLNELIHGLESAKNTETNAAVLHSPRTKNGDGCRFKLLDDSDDSDDDDDFEDAMEELDANDATAAVPEKDANEEEDLVVMVDDVDDELSRKKNMQDDGEFLDPPIRQLQHMEDRRPDAFDQGYDSDGEAAPADLTSSEEKELPEESALGETPPPPPAASDTNDDKSDIEDEDAPPNCPVHIPDDILENLKAAEIKDQLKIRNVTFPGRYKKPELKDRLKASLHLPVVQNVSCFKKKKKGSVDNNKKEKKDDVSEFAPGAYWRVLKPSDDVVEEPTNPSFVNQTVHAPTVASEDANKPQKLKHNFTEKFTRPDFKGKSNYPMKDSGGNVIKDNEGNVVYPTRTKGEPKAAFLKRHNLNKDSHPSEFVNAFFPLKMNPYKNSNQQPHLSISLCQQWTNLKALPSNAGTEDCYSDFKPFTLKEIQQHLGVYILNGLSPSPSIEMKFDVTDEANYNHFVATNIPNGVRRHRMFRCFFSVQDPRKPTPPRGTSPMFKLLPLINWINAVGEASWDLSINLSIDEQTIGFQGRHFAKLRITYKAEGDGFQVDALCDKGFTHSVYFRNERPPKKYTSKGLSPLIARVLWLFDGIEEEYTRAWMDNLFISAKLGKLSFNHPKKALIGGVARKDGRGIAMSVLQHEGKDKRQILERRGTVKAAVLEGDDDMPNLVCVSVYDTKPVHFITTICEDITWVRKTKKVWNESKQQMDEVKFLRLNVNNDYNMDMNSVDISDQLRNNCRFDHWLRNWKWWWAVFQWGFGALLVNAYVVYCEVMDQAGIPKKFRLTHYQFRLAAARVWTSREPQQMLEAWRRSRAPIQQNNDNSDSTEEPQSTSGRKRGRSKSPVRNTTSPAVSSLTTPNTSSSKSTIQSCGSTLKSNSSASSGELSRKCERITDNTIGPNGKLSCRLNFFNMKHLPVSRKAMGKTRCTRCALHRWALGRDCDMRSGVNICRDCLVPLCVDCYEVFHDVDNLVDQKSILKAKMEAEELALEEERKVERIKRNKKQEEKKKKMLEEERQKKQQQQQQQQTNNTGSERRRTARK